MVADFGTDGYFERLREVLEVSFDGPHIETFCFTPEELHKQLYEGHVTVPDSFEKGKILYGGAFFQPYLVKFQALKNTGLRKGKTSWHLPVERPIT
ncbi:MAG: hypothetical protein RBG13Loki_4299 [Promethearchaeota archaeon CR_4]|nr:MAG: hypothetical protein RBG13Loki_4299 [Candidatus Lokiarchaeota archaeon CR_4]